MPDADALLAAVLADPDADLPRLVFADHLDDAGDAARAEFVRLQCALAHDPARLPLRAREQTLLALHGVAWLRPLRAGGGPLENPGTHGGFRRGFVEDVWMPAGVFVRRADVLFRRTPARSLRVTRGTPGEIADLLAHPHLGRLRELTLTNRRLGDALAKLIADAPAGRLPPALDLRGCGLTVAAAHVLAGIGPAWRPAAVQVLFNPLMTDGGLEVLQARFGDAVRCDRPGVS